MCSIIVNVLLYDIYYVYSQKSRLVGDELGSTEGGRDCELFPERFNTERLCKFGAY